MFASLLCRPRGTHLNVQRVSQSFRQIAGRAFSPYPDEHRLRVFSDKVIANCGDVQVSGAERD
jgi:hypothetical protein